MNPIRAWFRWLGVRLGGWSSFKGKWYDLEFQLFGTRGKERQIAIVYERSKLVNLGGFSFSFNEIELAEPRKLHKRYTLTRYDGTKIQAL